MTADIVSYGNYNNLGGEVALQFYFMSIVFTMMGAYLASRDFEEDIKRTKKQRAKSGIKAALVATFIPGIIYWVLDTILSVIFKYPFNYNHFLGYFYGFQIFFVPVPAIIFGGLIGYFAGGTRGIGRKEGIKRFILIVSALILVEMIVFLVALNLVTGMELVPHDGGYCDSCTY
jgi:uncharacterized integral membrane protein